MVGGVVVEGVMQGSAQYLTLLLGVKSAVKGKAVCQTQPKGSDCYRLYEATSRTDGTLFVELECYSCI